MLTLIVNIALIALSITALAVLVGVGIYLTIDIHKGTRK